ncbi:MAG: exo-alpha-sialidase [Elusimicrobia bacterium]|nr:exo-alpha-sialidase [Elusimicrobiota bacterium]
MPSRFFLTALLGLSGPARATLPGWEGPPALPTLRAASGPDVRSKLVSLFRQALVAPKGTFPNNHGASIAEAPGGELLISWFAGSKEAARDARVFLVRYDPKSGAHTPPSIAVDRQEWPEGAPWSDKAVGNSALFVDDEGIAWLFYNGISVGGWSGAVINYKTSRDGGRSWSEGKRLISALGNLVRNPPIRLGPGLMLLPAYTELWTHKAYACRLAHRGGEISSISCSENMSQPEAIQPAIAEAGNGALIALMRDQRKKNIRRSWSHDGGASWSRVDRLDLPNPGSAVALVRIDDGRLVLVYNHSNERRSPLSIAVSKDGGASFRRIFDLEPAGGHGYSYPAIIQSSDGLLHVVYTYERKTIKHVTFDKSWLDSR